MTTVTPVVLENVPVSALEAVDTSGRSNNVALAPTSNRTLALPRRSLKKRAALVSMGVSLLVNATVWRARRAP